ncbi:Zn-dependent protease with chaperone function [Marinobacter daqiaonensis]|uniref:Zn-dependent protease with chaperone function n=1 Tax=Marinobacter daqiaonensis TaxID=650891 RepID=A0A1I6JF64_9GAMM|nr:M48 family metallopeptidase [Marinobacter daqiaonensis]SFR77582.1 Zn-dependent protease with chaperone function [Marinobacter daqiaonensis]
MSAPGFFERQAFAKRNTTLLVFLFSTAVILIALSVCLVGYLVTRSESTGLRFHDWMLSDHGLITTGTVVVLIVAGSAIRWFDLAGGGERVANMVGARQLDPSSQDLEERRFRNVVEEMAIASGVPVPQLYVMDQESAINAFVAGYSPNEAVMVVTHGALTQLTRDELQGVVAHEFSHILNGDMRINVRLIALLAGILTIGQIGFFLLRGASGRVYMSGSRNRNNGRAVMLMIGLALTVIGYVGVFFGRLIQAAVSRERERLADASSVQFTRNPDGIGGALFKIGQSSGYLQSTSHASDMNHMCFGESTKMAFSRLLGSHPPIDERIEAIQPGMLARLRSRLRDQPRPQQHHESPATPAGTNGFAASVHSPARGAAPSTHAGTVNPADEDYAVSLLARLPANARELLYTRTGAVQLLYALLTRDLAPEEWSKALWNPPGAAVLQPEPRLMERLLPTLKREGDVLRLPALELAMPALRQLDPKERSALIGYVATLAQADGRVSLFEFALHSFLQRHLGPGAGAAVPVRYRSYRQVLEDLNALFSLMARAGTRHEDEASWLHQETMASFVSGGTAATVSLERKVTIADLRESLKRLNQLSPMLKPAVLDACADCVTHDDQISVREYELLRLVADQLDVPLPPVTR